jgi:hypothetical protein
VHVESSTLPNSPSASTKSVKRPIERQPSVLEIMASTKCYPSWWADMDDSRLLRRRKSGADAVLERNLCFVDTPGFLPGEETSNMEVFRFIERTFSNIDTPDSMSDLERLNLISGKSSSLVDVVLFVFSNGKSFSDCKDCI